MVANMVAMNPSIESLKVKLVEKLQLIFVAFLVSLTCVVALWTPAFATDWETFTPPSKEYSISLPVGISRIAKDDGMDAIMYSSSDGDINCLIDDGSEINPLDQKMQDRFTQEVTDGMMERLNSGGVKNVLTTTKKVKGKGWHGTKTSVTIQGKKAMTVVVAVANNDDVAYTLMATAGDDNPKVANFFDSLVVEPTIATEAHGKKSFAYKSGVQIGKLLFWVLLFAVLAGALVTVVFFVRRNIKKQ